MLHYFLFLTSHSPLFFYCLSSFPSLSDFPHKHSFCPKCVSIQYIFNSTRAAAEAHFCDGSILKRCAVRNSFMFPLPKTCRLSLGAGAFWRDGAKQERYHWAHTPTHSLKHILHGVDLSIRRYKHTSLMHAYFTHLHSQIHQYTFHTSANWQKSLVPVCLRFSQSLWGKVKVKTASCLSKKSDKKGFFLYFL